MNYPWVMDDGQGCIFGKQMAAEVTVLTEKLETWEEKVDGMRDAMNKQAVAFGVAALFLALDIVLRFLLP